MQVAATLYVLLKFTIKINIYNYEDAIMRTGFFCILILLSCSISRGMNEEYYNALANDEQWAIRHMIRHPEEYHVKQRGGEVTITPSVISAVQEIAKNDWVEAMFLGSSDDRYQRAEEKVRRECVVLSPEFYTSLKNRVLLKQRNKRSRGVQRVLQQEETFFLFPHLNKKVENEKRAGGNTVAQ
jgi:hypothetical protein